MSKPQNLFVQEEPDYQVRIVHADLSQSVLNRYGRRAWKRLSAISHARYFALKNPDCAVHVELVR
jgi:hypothetical protein